jgi:hypothetical protein
MYLDKFQTAPHFSLKSMALLSLEALNPANLFCEGLPFLTRVKNTLMSPVR